LKSLRDGAFDHVPRDVEEMDGKKWGRVLTTPFAVDYADDSITLSDLRTRWEWDPLRNDPRFQKILAAPEPKAIRK